MADKKKKKKEEGLPPPEPPKLIKKPDRELTDDGTYWSSRRIDGYTQHPIKIVIGPREPGKSTWMYSKMWKDCCRGLTGCYVVRYKNKITQSLVDGAIKSVFSDFFEVPEFKLTAGASSGQANIMCNGWPVIRIVALNMQTDDIKRVIIPNLSFILFDEAVLDLSKGDRYMPGESKRIEELYSTLVRKKPNVPMYLLGNTYSLYNPYFLAYGIDGTKLKVGEIYTKGKVAVEYVKMSDRLKAKVLAANPFYAMDSEYAEFALEGKAVNDADIKLVRVRPRRAFTDFVLKIEGKYLAACRDLDSPNENRYWVGYTSPGEAKKSITYDVKELMEGSRVANINDKYRTAYFRDCFERRRITFQDLACYYLIEEIYTKL